NLDMIPVDFPEGVTQWLDFWGGVDFTLALGDDGILYE
ncbi:hypothetical protein MNBD_NITROSPINAE05-369, partial [hydrothermal vent metagenome]